MSEHLELTEENRANLERLATYLESLPEDYEHFDMLVFVGQREGSALNFLRDRMAEREYMRSNGGVENLGCGTVACALGHGPDAGILFREEELPSKAAARYGSPLEDFWHVYAERFIGRNTSSGYSIRFDWLFGSAWRHSDNHHWGAAARIRCSLATGHFEYPYDGIDYSKYRITKRKPLPKDFFKGIKHKPKRKARTTASAKAEA